MDYIQPATCTDSEFRKMWMEFEWENKVTIDMYTCIHVYIHIYIHTYTHMHIHTYTHTYIRSVT